MGRIHLSVPHLGEAEARHVAEAFATNWVSTVGPQLDAFERAFAGRLGRPAVAVASGTAAIHLGLRLLGVGPGDVVLTSDLTFVASVNPIRYLGAAPVLVDCDRDTWTMSPALLAEALEDLVRRGRRPRAVVVVHLYGQCADMDPILAACARHGVPVLEDAAEALGATYLGRPAGSLGEVAAFSFNGNKIVTCSGGGMLAASAAACARARHWATQAREPRAEYHHLELGYNYRLSNVLAGIGLGQLEVLDARVRQRRAVFERYRAALADLPGLAPMPEAGYGTSTRWLSCFLVDPAACGVTRDDLLAALARADVEARPVWKPMHLQPLHASCEVVGGAVGADLHARGLCLPSSSSLSREDQDRVVDVIRRTVRGSAGVAAERAGSSPDFLRPAERGLAGGTMGAPAPAAGPEP
jgi:pyridoxal phosphate-dependent aminotransferase EpsN